MKKLKKLFLPVLAAAFLAAPAQAADTLMMATTTSTQDTGLLEFLAPTFQKETGIELKWVAVGTGKALEILRTHLSKLHELAKYLLERETITGEEFMKILSAPVAELPQA